MNVMRLAVVLRGFWVFVAALLLAVPTSAMPAWRSDDWALNMLQPEMGQLMRLTKQQAPIPLQRDARTTDSFPYCDNQEELSSLKPLGKTLPLNLNEDCQLRLEPVTLPAGSVPEFYYSVSNEKELLEKKCCNPVGTVTLGKKGPPMPVQMDFVYLDKTSGGPNGCFKKIRVTVGYACHPIGDGMPAGTSHSSGGSDS